MAMTLYIIACAGGFGSKCFFEDIVQIEGRGVKGER
jgi:hypothetical protein